MFFYKVETKESALAGKGVYAAEDIPAGAIVALEVYQDLLMTEGQYQEAQRRGDSQIVQSGVRLVGDYFIYHHHIGDDEFINHSSNPNMLYHCGILFAKRNIATGEELTADYKYFLAQNDVNAFDDVETGKRADGLPPKEALMQSCRELMDLLSKHDLQPARYSDYKPGQ